METHAPSAPGGTLLLARQPIYDASLNVFAYELLHRSLDPSQSTINDGDAASSQLLLDAFGPSGIADLTEGHPAFINFTEHLILHPPAVSPGLLIVEVLEDVRPTRRIIEGLTALRARGFRIALDDFRHHAELEPLLELADIVKLDVLAMSEPELRAEVRKLRNHPVRLLAEKIESWEMHNHCADLGFSFFQGFFLAHPQVVHGERRHHGVEAVRSLLTQLLHARSAGEFASVLLRGDALAALRMLRLANGLDDAARVGLETVEEAAAMLGPRAAGRGMVAVLAGVEHAPRELVRLALARARACESLGKAAGPALAAKGFQAGLLSLIEAFLDNPLNDTNRSLMAAVDDRPLELAAMVRTAIAFEQADWASAPWETLGTFGVGKVEAEAAYLESLGWADRAMRAMFSG